MSARTEDQEMLAHTLHDLLAKHSGSEQIRTAMDRPEGFDPRLWELMCTQVGVAALAVPEEYDGFGATVAETGVVLEELGATLTPAPLLSSALSTACLQLYGSEQQQRELLPGLSAGEVVTIAAWPGAPGVVVDAVAGANVLAFDGTDLVPTSSRASAGMDPLLRLGDVASATPPPVDVAAIARALISCVQSGVAHYALTSTVAYAKERVQFGRSIGSFQALKHRMADMLVQVESARSASRAAVAAAAAYLDTRDEADHDALVHSSAVASSWCTQGLELLVSEMTQLHGGIAITWEHDAHLAFKRAHALATLAGLPHHSRAVLVEAT